MYRVRPVRVEDISAITRIYNDYIVNTVISFEVEPVSEAEMAQRINKVQTLALPWLVLETEQGVVGYAYATRWKARYAYRFAVETTIYLDQAQTGRGLGLRLYQALFNELKQASVHAVLGCITLPNPASIVLHEKMGMQPVAHFKAVGRKFEQWLDVGYWQIILGEE